MNLFLWRRRLARRAMALLVFGCAIPWTSVAGERERAPVRLQTLQQGEAGYLALAEASRKEAIERLRKLIESTPEGEVRAEMMLRLAELYVQQGRALYLQEMEACGDRLDCDNRGSKAWQERSVELYQAVLRSYPRYERADHATFFLGSVLDELGRREEAAETFRRLVKLYPSSSFVPDAYLLLGLYAFEVEQDAYKALSAFQRAAAFPDHPHRLFALYRLGWCQYNVGDYEGAIRSMQEVIQRSAEIEQQEGAFDLGEQALGDLVQFYADADMHEEARPFLERIGRHDLVPDMLRRMASRLVEQGRRPEAVAVLRQLILERPLHEDNPALGMEVVTLFDQTADRDRVLSELSALRTLYAEDSDWARRHPERIAATRAELSALHLKLARAWHEAARQRDRSRQSDAMALYRQAGELYQAQLDAFPHAPDRAEALYLHGELLYRLGDYAGAYERYIAVVDHDPQGPRARFCAESAIHAAEAQIKAEGGKLLPPGTTPDKDTAPQPLTAWEQRYVDACSRYAELYPDGKVQEALYGAAYLLYARYRFDEASVLFQRVVARDPRSPQARLAADLILDALVIREDWDALAQTARAFSEHPALGDRLFREDLAKIHANAEFKRIEAAHAQSGDDLAAARQLEAYVEQFPASPNVPLALNNAAAWYSASGHHGEAMAVRERLVALGETPYLRDQVALLGFDRERIADYVGAADLYERLQDLPPQDERTIDALYSAVLLRIATGDLQAASRDADALGKLIAPSDRRRIDAELALIRAEQQARQHQQAIARCITFDEFEDSSATERERYWVRLQLGRSLLALGDPKQAAQTHAQTVARWKAKGAPPEAVEEVAQALLDSLAPAREAYFALKISGPGRPAPKRVEDAALKASVAAKLQALRALEEQLHEVVAMGAARPGLAALFMVGEAYEELAQALAQSDRPRTLTPEQLEAYERELEDRVYAQEQKAFAAYRLVVDRSQQLGLPGSLAAQAASSAARLRPEDFSVGSELLPAPFWLASARPVQVASYETALTAQDPALSPTSGRRSPRRPPQYR